MGFLGLLGRLFLGPLGSRIGDAGKVASGYAGSAAQGRLLEGQILTERDRNAIERARAELSQRLFALDAPAVRAQQARTGDILANTQDVGFVDPTGRIRPVQFTGGLRPSLHSADTQAFGHAIRRQALLNTLQGDTFPPIPVSTLPGPGWAERASRTGGFLASLFGALRKPSSPSSGEDLGLPTGGWIMPPGGF